MLGKFRVTNMYNTTFIVIISLILFKKMKPNNPPCFIRQNSRDISRPDMPAAPPSYIRSDSTLSQLSVDGYLLGAPSDENGILDMLAASAEADSAEVRP